MPARSIIDSLLEASHVPGTKVIVNGSDGVVVRADASARGRHGVFDPRREVMVKVGSRVKPFRKGDVELPVAPTFKKRGVSESRLNEIAVKAEDDADKYMERIHQVQALLDFSTYWCHPGYIDIPVHTQEGDPRFLSISDLNHTWSCQLNDETGESFELEHVPEAPYDASAEAIATVILQTIRDNRLIPVPKTMHEATNTSPAKKGQEGHSVATDAAEKYGVGTVPNHDGGKAPISAGRRYWRDVKGKVARVGSTYYVADGENWFQVYWDGHEGAAATAKLSKLAEPDGLPESKKKKRVKTPTKTTFSRTYFGTKYKPNRTVVAEAGLPDPEYERHDRSLPQRQHSFRNKLGVMSTGELEQYLTTQGNRWYESSCDSWQCKMLRTFAKQHGIDWPKEAKTESLPDPGLKVRYEDINNVLDETRPVRLQNDTKCTLKAKKRSLKEWGERVADGEEPDRDRPQDDDVAEPTLADTWAEDKDGEYIHINDDDSIWYVAHGRAMEQIFCGPGDDKFSCIRHWFDENGVSLNIWQINDHGNATLFDSDGHDLGGIV